MIDWILNASGILAGIVLYGVILWFVARVAPMWLTGTLLVFITLLVTEEVRDFCSPRRP